MRALFANILPPSQILDSPTDTAHYGKDWAKQFKASSPLILLPSTTEQVQQIIKVANKERLSIVPSGGRTGLSGGATATRGEIVLSLERMNKILNINVAERTLTCEAGVITQRIQDEAIANGLYYPVEFTTKGSAQIGGNVATNAGGIRVVKYGNTREWVLGVKAVSGAGDILELNGRLIKNNTGYDLRHLMIASEGTLGIITEVTVRLTTLPDERLRMLCAIDSVDRVLPILTAVRNKFPRMSAFEFFTDSALTKVLKHHPLSNPFIQSYPNYVLIEIERDRNEPRNTLEEFFGNLIETDQILDMVIAATSKQGDDLLSLRERIGETLSSHYCPHKNDLAVPVGSIPSFVKELHALISREYPDFEVIVFGHIGDGNLHVNILKPDRLSADEFFKICHEADNKTFALVKKFSGSVSAEHGIGLLKKDFLGFSRSNAEIAIMRGIKRTFDPNGILNPGKIFDL